MRRYSDVVRSSFHFINGLRCQSHRHGASCAVDTLMEIFKQCFMDRDPTLITYRECNLLMSALIRATEARAVFGPVCEVRDTVWDLLVHILPNAYHPKGRHDADIEAAFQFLSHNTGTKFALSNSSLLACTRCGVNRHVTASTSPILYYTQGVNGMYPNNLAAGVCATLQQQIADQFTTVRLCSCDSQLINVKNSVYMPDFLMLRLEVSGDNIRNLQVPSVVAPQSMCIMGHMYILVGAIQMGPTGGHFLGITLSNHGTFVVTDDLQDCVGEFPTFSAAVSRCVLKHSWETPLTPQHAGVPMLFYQKAQNMPLATSADQAYSHMLPTQPSPKPGVASLPRDPASEPLPGVAALPRDPASEPLPGVAALPRDPASEPLPGVAALPRDPASEPLPGVAALPRDPASEPLSRVAALATPDSSSEAGSPDRAATPGSSSEAGSPDRAATPGSSSEAGSPDRAATPGSSSEAGSPDRAATPGSSSEAGSPDRAATPGSSSEAGSPERAASPSSGSEAGTPDRAASPSSGSEAGSLDDGAASPSSCSGTRSPDRPRIGSVSTKISNEPDDIILIDVLGSSIPTGVYKKCVYYSCKEVFVFLGIQSQIMVKGYGKILDSFMGKPLSKFAFLQTKRGSYWIKHNFLILFLKNNKVFPRSKSRKSVLCEVVCQQHRKLVAGMKNSQNEFANLNSGTVSLDASQNYQQLEDGAMNNSPSVDGLIFMDTSTDGQPLVDGQPLTFASTDGQPLTVASADGQPLTVASTDGQPLTVASTDGQPLTVASTDGQPLTVASTESDGQPLTASSADDPMSGCPSADDPMSGCPSVDDPMSGCPSVDDPMSGCPSADDPMSGCPSVDDSMSGCPSADDPMNSSQADVNMTHKGSPTTTKRAVNNSEQDALERGYITLLGVAVEYIIKDGSLYVETDSAFGLVGLRESVIKNTYSRLDATLNRIGHEPEKCYIIGERNTRPYIWIRALYCLLSSTKAGDKSKKQALQTDIFLAMEMMICQRRNSSDNQASKKQSNVVKLHEKKDLDSFISHSYHSNTSSFMRDLAKLVCAPDGVSLTQEDIMHFFNHCKARTKKKVLLHCLQSYYNAQYPVEPLQSLFMSENFTGERLRSELRKALPGLFPSDKMERVTKKQLEASFNACLLPRRSALGWHVDPERLLQILTFRYPFLQTPIHIKITGDGREYGGRQSTFVALTVLNNELLLQNVSYQSPKECFPLSLFY